MPLKRSRKKKAVPDHSASDSGQQVVKDVPNMPEEPQDILVVEADVHREPESDDVQSVEDETFEADPIEVEGEADSPKDSSKDKKRKPRITSYVFTDEQEKDLGEWYREHECLYNRRHKLYKDSKHKQRLYIEKAESLTPKCTCK
jgi:hypothetical protein